MFCQYKISPSFEEIDVMGYVDGGVTTLSPHKAIKKL